MIEYIINKSTMFREGSKIYLQPTRRGFIYSTDDEFSSTDSREFLIEMLLA